MYRRWSPDADVHRRWPLDVRLRVVATLSALDRRFCRHQEKPTALPLELICAILEHVCGAQWLGVDAPPTCVPLPRLASWRQSSLAATRGAVWLATPSASLLYCWRTDGAAASDAAGASAATPPPPPLRAARHCDSDRLFDWFLAAKSAPTVQLAAACDSRLAILANNCVLMLATDDAAARVAFRWSWHGNDANVVASSIAVRADDGAALVACRQRTSRQWRILSLRDSNRNDGGVAVHAELTLSFDVGVSRVVPLRGGCGVAVAYAVGRAGRLRTQTATALLMGGRVRAGWMGDWRTVDVTDCGTAVLTLSNARRYGELDDSDYGDDTFVLHRFRELDGPRPTEVLAHDVATGRTTRLFADLDAADGLAVLDDGRVAVVDCNADHPYLAILEGDE